MRCMEHLDFLQGGIFEGFLDDNVGFCLWVVSLTVYLYKNTGFLVGDFFYVIIFSGAQVMLL